ncbi:MAG: PP2C family protein-serine/threonine phosphatase [Acidobacteriota bacterium]
MRIIPRFVMPKINPMIRHLKRLRRYFTVPVIALLIEMLLLAAALIFIFTGSRASWLDRHGARYDLLVLSAILIVFFLLHLVTTRKIIPWINQKLSPPVYDERRILFDFGQEAHKAKNISQLYQSLVRQIGEALKSENVSIFVRDDATGNFLCRISSDTLSDSETSQSGDLKENSFNPDLTIAKEAFVIKRLQYLTKPMPVTTAEYEAWEKALTTFASETREARMRESAILKRIRTRLLIKLTLKEQIIGLISLGPRRGEHQYSERDQEMLMSIASQVALVIENSKLIERIVAEEKLRREIMLAADVQKRLFPEKAPVSSVVDLTGFCQPARGIGGDYYDFLPFENDKIGFAIADVSGKGISAALVMSNVQASLRSQTMAHPSNGHKRSSIVEMVSTLNKLLCQSTGSSTYVTFFYAQIDGASRMMTYVNAGHNPPFILRKAPDGEDYLKMTTGGSVIGMFDSCLYEEETIPLQSGDILIAFTDGVSEALSAIGEEFSEERLIEAVSRVAHLPVEEIREAIVREVQMWCEGAPQHDDLTFVVVKVK